MKMKRIVDSVRSADRWHFVAALLIACLLLFLVVRATDDYRWSDWGFGDAQTMLSLRQWEEGGWLNNYLLFKPQGYAKAIDLLDDPELRQHAHGTCPGSSPRVGPRLWYTHYPAGYLLPYAALFRIGLDSMVAVRTLSILFSLGALTLMYLVFAKISTPRVSFLAVLFYALSSSFLGYADSLANQPIDDLLRFGFMYAVVMSTRAGESHRRRWMITAWITEFLLSLTSFDSVFFVYTWLIGWDFLERRGFRWKTYLVYALAPVTAHGLQFLQNVWYLGWQDAWIDIKDAFLLKHGSDSGYNSGQGRFGVILISVLTVLQNLVNPLWLLALVMTGYGIYIRMLSEREESTPSLKLLLVLFLSGLAFIVVLPHAARMPYEARQMVPFAALLISGWTWSFLTVFRRAIHHDQGVREGTAGPRFWIAAPYLLFSAVLILVLWYRFVFSDRTPVYELGPRKEEMQFAEQLTMLQTRYEPVYFDMGGFSLYWDPKYVPGYPQILPLTEYYAGSRPILCFDEAEKAAEDIATMVRKSSGRFSPVLIARNPEFLDRVIALLLQGGTLSGRPQSSQSAMDRYALDLTDYIRWGGHEADTHSRKP